MITPATFEQILALFQGDDLRQQSKSSYAVVSTYLFASQKVPFWLYRTLGSRWGTFYRIVGVGWIIQIQARYILDDTNDKGGVLRPRVLRQRLWGDPQSFQSDLVEALLRS